MDPFENNDIEETKEDICIKKVTIWIETHGKKKNTFIKDLDLEESVLKDHLKNIKKKHGCNGSLKDNVLQFQGDHIHNVKSYLNSIGINNIIINSSGSE